MPSPARLADISFKPRVLIADDSRIVRATLIKHIQGIFEFREAVDGQSAWEILLLDPTIRLFITDLTMPRLDGYTLLERIRTSRIERIRNMPVVVVSGSDESEERERALAAGATDLITKGIATAQLLSRLDILSKLVNSQRQYEQSLQALLQTDPAQAAALLSSPFDFQAEAEAMLEYARRHRRDFILLCMCVGARAADPDAGVASLPPEVASAIGMLLKKTVRSTDSVAQTGAAEFTLASGSINLEGARGFAQRLCGAIAGAKLPDLDSLLLVASCGLASHSEQGVEVAPLNALWEMAQGRAMRGLRRGRSGVVGAEEAQSLL